MSFPVSFEWSGQATCENAYLSVITPDGAEIRNLDNEGLDIQGTADEKDVPHPREVC